MPKYPDTEGYAYSFDRAELTLDGTIYTAISNVEIDQPTEEGSVKGTKSYPLARTIGSMDLGEGTITFSDDAERLDFIDKLGDAWREKTWPLSYVISAPGRTSKKIACKGCRVLSNPVSHESGPDALGGDIIFSFMEHTINGKSPHSKSS